VAWLDVDGARLEVRGWGREHDLCGLVFLHEGLGSVHAWRDVPGQLAELTGFSAVAYSREGYGASAALRAPFAADFMHREAERLEEVLRGLQVQVPVLVGHSDAACP
jgi:pimeloyl-ACP methyl ester carboxylesterase